RVRNAGVVPDGPGRLEHAHRLAAGQPPRTASGAVRQRGTECAGEVPAVPPAGRGVAHAGGGVSDPTPRLQPGMRVGTPRRYRFCSVRDTFFRPVPSEEVNPWTFPR